MENKQNLFEKFPIEYIGLVFVLFGLIIFIGALLRWKWVLDMTGERSDKPFGFIILMYDWFGDNGVRAGLIILSILIIFCGLVLFILTE